jgi:nicotinate-nucleotide pyrophosphorylase (carboxylating)
MGFTDAEAEACRRLVEMAWAEDLGPRPDLLQGGAPDVTSQSFVPPHRQGRAAFVGRAPGVVAGLPAVALVLDTVHTPLVKLEPLVEDGARVQPGDHLAVVTGLMQFILMAERTALNFLQHMSGVATTTRRYVDGVAGLPCSILDTRKTLPGWRLLEKYAVRCGGGQNHRLGLYDGILIKDNHLALQGGGLAAFQAVFHVLEELRARGAVSGPVEIEVDTLEQLDWAIGCHPDVVLLDNMSTEQLREAVRRRNGKAPRIVLEASGGVTLTTVRDIAETGVDRISVGAITHSANALDIGLDYLDS